MRRALVYSKRLKEAGLTQEMVDAHISILEEVVEDEMATKADIQNLESRIELRLQAMSSKIDQMEYKLTIRMGLMLVAAVGVLSALIKLT